KLTTAEIRNSKAYKEYHACVMGEAAPKSKVSARKKKGTGSKPGVPDVPSDDSEEELSWNSFDDEDTGKGGDEVRESEDESDDEETREEEEESFDPIPRTPEESEEESNDEEEQESRLSEEAR
nr:hypothetical protein [Tanacetum cinerariifolium]